MFRPAQSRLLPLAVGSLTAAVLTAGQPEMCGVSGGGQPSGPEYSFYISKYEITNEQFVVFLNEERAASKRSAESYVVFDAFGNAFLGPSAGRETQFQPTYWRLFSITNMYWGTQTGIEYRSGRYAVAAGRGKHPVIGVSWFGAVRYCNWLTVRTGMGEKQCCYSMGPSSEDWHPANVTYRQWVKSFNAEQRREWVVKYRGFRLPMDDGKKRASPYNEYYKAAAWNGKKNTRYAFGRDAIGPADANYGGSGDPCERSLVRTTPVGYYDGTVRDGFRTRVNENLYGVYDLSGNAAELMEDCPRSSSLLARALGRRELGYRIARGGSWSGRPLYRVWLGSAEALKTNLRFQEVAAISTHDWVGFRVVRTEADTGE